MRKYFLLSAVALLATSTANATTDYAEITAKAKIEVAGTLNCTDFDFGTIVLKQNNGEVKIDYGQREPKAESGGEYILSYPNVYSLAICPDDNGASFDVENNITLTGTKTENTKTILMETADTMSYGQNQRYVLSRITIPANIVADEYTGSLIITATY